MRSSNQYISKRPRVVNRLCVTAHSLSPLSTSESAVEMGTKPNRTREVEWLNWKIRTEPQSRVILFLLSTANSYTCEHIYIKASEQLFPDAIKPQDFEVFIAFLLYG